MQGWSEKRLGRLTTQGHVSQDEWFELSDSVREQSPVALWANKLNRNELEPPAQRLRETLMCDGVCCLDCALLPDLPAL